MAQRSHSLQKIQRDHVIQSTKNYPDPEAQKKRVSEVRDLEMGNLEMELRLQNLESINRILVREAEASNHGSVSEGRSSKTH